MSKEKFSILETISEGPSTTVYKAVQNVLGRTVLLKVLHRHLLGDQELVERFRREAAACAMLRSDFIVQVYNLDELDGAPAIVMEFVEGESLKDYLSRTGDRSEAFARTVAVSVLRGLVAAHRQGIVHRDIKPGNILVTPDGTVRITDFGLASVLASPGLTVEGVLVGTPAYMSPEQARGESLDSRTDLFSLGITLAEVVSGKQIFHGTSYGECINKITHFRPESLEPLVAGVSKEFQQFLGQLMQPDKEKRFPSAAEALSVLTGTPVPDGPPNNRRPLWPVGVAALAVTGVILVGYYLTGFSPEPGPVMITRMDSSSVTEDSLQSATAPPQIPASVPARPENPPEKRAEVDPPLDTASVAFAQDDSGYVSITCDPWAKVYLNDQYVGTTPIAGSIRVAAGSHTIAFNNPQFTPIIRTITVQKNEELPVNADFIKTSGYLLFVSVKPWAEIFVDDQYRETTPLNQPLVVSSGNRKIRLHNPSFPDHVLEIGVKTGDTIRVSHDFRTPSPQQ